MKRIFEFVNQKQLNKLLFFIKSSHTIPIFNDSKGEEFGKHCGKRRKMLVTSIYSFSHSVFYSIIDINHNFSNVVFVVCKCFRFGHVQDWIALLRRHFLHSAFFLFPQHYTRYTICHNYSIRRRHHKFT